MMGIKDVVIAAGVTAGAAGVAAQTPQTPSPLPTSSSISGDGAHAIKQTTTVVPGPPDNRAAGRFTAVYSAADSPRHARADVFQCRQSGALVDAFQTVSGKSLAEAHARRGIEMTVSKFGMPPGATSTDELVKNTVAAMGSSYAAGKALCAAKGYSTEP